MSSSCTITIQPAIHCSSLVHWKQLLYHGFMVSFYTLYTNVSDPWLCVLIIIYVNLFLRSRTDWFPKKNREKTKKKLPDASGFQSHSESWSEVG